MFIGLEDSLGQLEVVGAAIQAVGTVTASFITADATKYAARQNSKTELMVALTNAKTALEVQKAQTEAEKVTQESQTERTKIGTNTVEVAIIAVTVLGIVAAVTYVMKE